jgi:hypothetical protein
MKILKCFRFYALLTHGKPSFSEIYYLHQKPHSNVFDNFKSLMLAVSTKLSSVSDGSSNLCLENSGVTLLGIGPLSLEHRGSKSIVKRE